MVHRYGWLALSISIALLLSVLPALLAHADSQHKQVAVTIQGLNKSPQTHTKHDVKAEDCDYLLWAGVLAYHSSRYDAALALFQEALSCFQDIADRAEEGNTLNNIAVLLASQGRYQEALESYEQALAILREVGDRATEGRTLHNIASVYKNQGRYQEALESYEQALAILREVGDRATEGATLNGIAGVYDNQGQYREAMERYEQALTILRQVGDRATEGRTLHNIASVYKKQGRYQEALESYEQALAILREVGDRAGEGTTLHGIAVVYDSQGRYQEALDGYGQALAIAREVGDRNGEGETLNGIAVVYHNQGRYQEALDNYEQALAIRREVGDRAGEGRTLSSIAGVYAGQGHYQEALEGYEQALRIRREVGDRAGEGETLNNIANVYSHRGRYQEALASYQQALAIVREVGNRPVEGYILNNIAGVYLSQGHYQEALDSYEQALEIVREVGDRATEGGTLNNIAAVYYSQRRHQEAIETLEKALAIVREVGDRAREGVTLNNIATVYDRQGRYQEALDTYQQALAIRREVGDRTGEGTTLNGIASVYDRQGRYQEALGTFKQALAIEREVGDRAGEGRTLHNIAHVYSDQERYQEALETYEQALEVVHEVGDRATEGSALNKIASVYYVQGRYQEALDTYEQAADVLESVRAVAGSEKARAAFIDHYSSVYDGMVEAALHLNKPDVAFLASERGRARAFLDSLATGEVQLADVSDANLLADEQEAFAVRQTAQDALAAAHRLVPPNPTLVAQRETELQKADQQLEQVRSKIAAQGEQLAALVPGRSNVLTLAQVQALLDKETTLVSYRMLKDKTLAFVITADDFTLVELPDATPEAVQGAVESLYQWSSRENPFPRPLRNLYTWLIAPLAPHLTTPYVAIVPHQQLHYVPFAALTDGQQYLGQQHVLSLLPSATSLKFLQQNAQTAQQLGWNKILVFGNPATKDLPPLPAAEDEAQAVGDLFHTSIYTGTQASEVQLRQQVAGSAIVHLAAHGSYNDANPLYSAIALAADDSDGDKEDSDGGRLEAREVYALPLKGTELVTLSACQSSVGALSRGDELVGLTRAFFFAGTPSVISSLWSVDDAATSALMTAFYRNWRERDMDKAAALQAAQAEVAATPQWRSPFFWAPFVLHGDTGQTQ